MRKLTTFKDYSSIKLIFFDFDGVFTDNNVLIDEAGSEYVRCSRYDGFGISMLHSCGIKTCVITSESIPLAKKRCEKLGIVCFHSVSNKLEFGLDYVRFMDCTPEQTAFLGNDINDLALLQVVGLPIVTVDSHSSVHYHDFYSTDLPGGHGCVREVADYFITQNLC